MIEKISGIKIKGKCFINDTNFVFFPEVTDRVAIVYGKNGSGKSTISNGVLNAVNPVSDGDIQVTFVDPDNNEIDISKHKDGFYVFNEKYVDENVKIDDDGLGTIILLGTQANLQTEIEALEKKEKFAKSEYDEATRIWEPFFAVNNISNPDTHWKKIQNILKSSGGWAETDSKIRNLKQNTPVTDRLINEILQLTTKESKEELKIRFDQTNLLLEKTSESTESMPEEIQQVFFEEEYEQNIIELLSKKIEKPVLSERENLIFSLIKDGEQLTIENAKQYFSNHNVSICPFCYQSVSEEYKRNLMESINRVLNKDVETHKSELENIIFPDFSLDTEKFYTIDNELTTTIIKQVIECKQIVDKYEDTIKKKVNSIFNPIQTKKLNLFEAVNNLNELLLKLENKRKEFNYAIKRRRELIDELILLNKQIARYDILQTYKDYKKQIKQKESFQDILKEKEKVYLESQESLNAMKQQKKDIGLAINNINNAMDYIFFKKGRLAIELKNDKYYLKSNGCHVRPKDVSVGERNIIALCYFFTQIVSNQEISKLYQSEEFVVIDDPVSSFDFENKVGIISFLRYQINRIVSGNNASKIVLLSHDISTIFDLYKATQEIIESKKANTTINHFTFKPWELNGDTIKRFEKRRSEYSILVNKVYDYAATGNGEDSISIGNNMRRMLEAFSTFTYRKSIEDVSCDQNVLKDLKQYSMYFENLMYRLVLHNESHYEEQVYNMHDGINFYEYISDDEKIRTAKDVLCFMYLLNPTHIISYINNKDYIANIKKWCKNLPINSQIEELKSEEIQLKKIKLFDIALAAGSGNMMFDDISFEEFETDNFDADFALRIAGDSMSPEIPDKSIVLIKATETIDSEEIGAFYHNGEVKCKKYYLNNNKAFLVSLNKNYAPIQLLESDEVKVYGKIIETLPKSNS